MNDTATLNLDKFYPTELLRITETFLDKSKIKIYMKSVTESCECFECKQISNRYHGTYIRKVQDLPILGKQVELEITAREYNCENDSCKVSAIAETYNGFLNYYSRMTERCADFIVSAT